jgi:hypothetical protein
MADATSQADAKRFDRLTADVGTLFETVNKLSDVSARTETMLDGVIKTVGHLTHAVEAMSTNQEAAGKTNWGVMISGAALTVTVISVIGGIVVSQIYAEGAAREATIQRIADIGLASIQEYPPQMFVTGIANNKVRITELNVVLQREIALTVENTKEASRLTDERLQMEIRLLGNVSKERIQGVMERVKMLEAHREKTLNSNGVRID